MAGASLGGMAFMHEQGGLPIPDIVHIPQPYWYGEGGGLSPHEFGLRMAHELEKKILELGADRVAAFIGEPIQGAGGVLIPPETYWPEINRICKQYDILLIADEVMSGFGRCGEWFAWQRYGAAGQPDLMTLAKGLASGVPIGACVTAGNARGLFGPGNHGSTFGGNPLACAAGLATFDTIVDDKLMDNAIAIGGLIRKSMAEALADVVGEGLMIGIELDRPCGVLMGRATEQGLLLSVTADRVIRLLPALTFSADEAQTLVSMLAPMIRDFLANG